MEIKMNLIMNKNIDNLNLIKQPAICCIYCGKSYKKRNFLDKHLILCEFYNKSKNNKLNTQDDFIPSQQIMYNLILELALKCKKLENKVHEMGKYIHKKHKKIDILEYLNDIHSTSVPICKFENITENIKIESCDIEFLFINDFFQTINHILVKYFENKPLLPIIAFNEKKNTLYIYTKNNINNSYHWTIMPKEHLIRFLNIIQLKISKSFSEWRKNNIQLLDDKDNNSDKKIILLDKTYSKLMEPDFKNETTYNKYYNNIYHIIKKELQYTKYEIE